MGSVMGVGAGFEQRGGGSKDARAGERSTRDGEWLLEVPSALMYCGERSRVHEEATLVTGTSAARGKVMEAARAMGNGHGALRDAEGVMAAFAQSACDAEGDEKQPQQSAGHADGNAAHVITNGRRERYARDSAGQELPHRKEVGRGVQRGNGSDAGDAEHAGEGGGDALKRARQAVTWE
ncbi:hypothetical protein B0H13DRAFT_1904810 [Mycena leptocephala]|nr:hypothetical protein B0H13DRAFT_1904810 [Mycena leptocephala]